MKKHTKKILLIILIIILTSLIALHQISPKLRRYLETQQIERINIETMESITQNQITTPDPTQSQSQTTTQPPSQIPSTLPIAPPEQAYIEVPFICQAPLQTEENWTFHEESCEEAAFLQAYLYETGQTMTKQEAHEEILRMIDWQIQNFGSHHDIYAEELKSFIIGYYNIDPNQITVILDASLEEIKTQIARGHPVIVPITGKILQNPYYPHPGYHMLTVIGYTEDRIITNDNGTRRGQDFSYDNQTFKTAMNDAGGDIVVLELN